MVQINLPENSKVQKGNYYKDKTGSKNIKKGTSWTELDWAEQHSSFPLGFPMNFPSEIWSPVPSEICVPVYPKYWFPENMGMALLGVENIAAPRESIFNISRAQLPYIKNQTFVKNP